MVLNKKGIKSEYLEEKRISNKFYFGFFESHYLFCNLKINNSEKLHFSFDTGLDSEQVGALSNNTFDYLNLKMPFLRIPVIGTGGSGLKLYLIGVKELGLIKMGSIQKENKEVLSGIFPDDLYFNPKLGFIVDGLISQEFINNYACTLDL